MGTETFVYEMKIIAPLLVVAAGLITLVCITSMSRVDKASGDGLTANVETTAQAETAKSQKSRIHGSTDPRIHVSTDSRIHGFTVSWFHGCIHSWINLKISFSDSLLHSRPFTFFQSGPEEGDFVLSELNISNILRSLPSVCSGMLSFKHAWFLLTRNGL